MSSDKLTVSKDDVENFRKTCIWLRSLWLHYQILFKERELLQSIAPIFFSDIHYLLQRNLVLVICNITDPAETGDHMNLTVEFLIKYSDFSSAPRNISDKLKELGESMRAFRKKIVLARNKLIAHLDRESVQLGQPLGGAPQDDWLQFWHDLQGFLHIMHKHYVDADSPFWLNAIAQSDAEILVQALKEST